MIGMSLHRKCFDKFILRINNNGQFSFMLCRNPKLVSVGGNSNREKCTSQKNLDMFLEIHSGDALRNTFGNVLQNTFESTMGSFLFHALQKSKAGISWLLKSNREKCKSQTNSVCSQARYRSALSPGPSQDEDDQILMSISGSNIGGVIILVSMISCRSLPYIYQSQSNCF